MSVRIDGGDPGAATGACTAHGTFGDSDFSIRGEVIDSVAALGSAFRGG